MGVEVVTLGCRLNAAESETMRRRALAAGIGDAVIVNTCAVTNEAVSQARQTIRRLRREVPDRRVIVTGCAVQTDLTLSAACRKSTISSAMPRSLTRLPGRVSRCPRPDARASPMLWRCGPWHRTLPRHTRCRHAPFLRCRMAAITAAPSASSPLAVALRALRHGRGGRADPPAQRSGIAGGGAHRRRSHKLWA